MLDVAYSLDHGYVVPVAVSIKSLLENRDSDLLRIHILGYHITNEDIVGGWFLASQTLERASRHRIKIGMHYRDGYVWAALAIVAANFLVKNLLLLWDIDLLKGITLY